MPTTYEPVGRETKSLISEVMQRHHPDLHSVGVRISALEVFAPRNQQGVATGPAIKLGGYQCAATIKIQPLKQRVLGVGDAVLHIDGDRWHDWSQDFQEALIDHELTHLQVKWVQAPYPDSNGELVGGVAAYDDWGRPRLETRLHDWQLGGFRDVANRHGQAAPDVQTFNQALDDHGQYLLPYLEGVERSIGQSAT